MKQQIRKIVNRITIGNPLLSDYAKELITDEIIEVFNEYKIKINNEVMVTNIDGKITKITEITEEELFEYYLSRERDDIYDFHTYKKLMEKAGTKITHKDEQ